MTKNDLELNKDIFYQIINNIDKRSVFFIMEKLNYNQKKR